MANARSESKWNALRPDYRKRLERHGITKDKYLSGGPLTAARGHAKTPERPTRAFAKPDAYPEYVRARTGQTPKLSIDREAVYKRARRMFLDALNNEIIESLDLVHLRNAINAVDHVTLARMMTLDLDGWRDLGKHQRPPQGYWVTLPNESEPSNPFWYH